MTCQGSKQKSKITLGITKLINGDINQWYKLVRSYIWQKVYI